MTLTQTEFNVLSQYITWQQATAGISPSDRVQLVLIQTGNPPKLASGHSSSVSDARGRGRARRSDRNRVDSGESGPADRRGTWARSGRAACRRRPPSRESQSREWEWLRHRAERFPWPPGAGAGAGPQVRVVSGGLNMQAGLSRPQGPRSVKERLIAPTSWFFL